MNNPKITWYRPREVARLGMITNSKQSDKENSNYIFVLNLIKNGRLKAKNYSYSTRPYWLVSDKEIDRYNNKED